MVWPFGNLSLQQVEENTNSKKLSSTGAQTKESSLVSVGDRTVSDQRSFQYSNTDARRYASTNIDSRSYQTTDARVFAPTTQITVDSPGATVTSKKEASSAPTPSIAPVFSMPIDQGGAVAPSQSAEPRNFSLGGSTVLIVALVAGGIGVAAIAARRKK